MEGRRMDAFDRYMLFKKEIAEANLKVINQFLSGVEPVKPKTCKRTSNIKIVWNILNTAGRPLHISDIIEIAKQDFNADLERDSIVSSIVKKIKAGKTFIRTAPNTFALKDYTSGGPA
jgi:hypothetical protein